MRSTVLSLVVGFSIAAPFQQALADRQFNNTEKQIIEEIVKYPVGVEEGLFQIAAFLEDHYIGPERDLTLRIQVPEKKVYVSIPENDKVNLRKKLIITLTIFYLLRDLQQEGKITLIGESQKESVELGDQFKEGQTANIPEPIAGFVIDCFAKYVLVTEDLKHLVETGFEDPERIRHKQTMIIAIIALIVSVLLGLWGVFRDLFVKSCTYRPRKF
jgi:hypothetical protein